MKDFLRGKTNILLVSIGGAITTYFLLGIRFGSGYVTGYHLTISEGVRLGAGIGVFFIIFGVMRSKQK